MLRGVLITVAKSSGVEGAEAPFVQCISPWMDEGHRGSLIQNLSLRALERRRRRKNLFLVTAARGSRREARSPIAPGTHIRCRPTARDISTQRARRFLGWVALLSAVWTTPRVRLTRPRPRDIRPVSFSCVPLSAFPTFGPVLSCLFNSLMCNSTRAI